MPLINPCDTPDMHKDEALCFLNLECEYIWEAVTATTPAKSYCQVKFVEPVYDHCADYLTREGNSPHE